MNVENKEGQALLLVLLAMATLATMVLSVVSRSVTEVSVTTREDESLRAFSAAEAGVEEALIRDVGSAINSGPVTISETTLDIPAPSGGTAAISSYSGEISRYPTDPTKFNYPFELISGQAGSVWFRTREGDTILDCTPPNCFTGTDLTLCWRKEGASGEIPAVVANIIYEDTSGSVATRAFGFDSEGSRRATNNFDPPNANNNCNNVDGEDYQFGATINLSSLPNRSGPPILMRVTTLYNPNTPGIFGVSTSSGLPIQGRKVTSEGKSGESTRKIDAYLLNPEIPFIFDAAVYSELGISK